jgi:hypothetical protein
MLLADLAVGPTGFDERNKKQRPPLLKPDKHCSATPECESAKMGFSVPLWQVKRSTERIW